MFPPFSGHPRLHEARRALGENDLWMRRDVIAVRVRDKGERFRLPRVEPEIRLRQINAALITHFDHFGNLCAKKPPGRKIGSAIFLEGPALSCPPHGARPVF